MNFTDKFDVTNDPNQVFIHFKKSRVNDMTAINALNSITKKYNAAGKTVHLKHLSNDCIQLLKNAEAVIDVNIYEDPTYKVMSN